MLKKLNFQVVIVGIVYTDIASRVWTTANNLRVVRWEHLKISHPPRLDSNTQPIFDTEVLWCPKF